MSVSELEMRNSETLKYELGENYGRLTHTTRKQMSNLQKQMRMKTRRMQIKYSKAIGKIEGAYGALTRADRGI